MLARTAIQEETVTVDFIVENFQQVTKQLTKLAVHCRKVAGSLLVTKISPTRFVFVCQHRVERAITVLEEKVATEFESICFERDVSNLEGELAKIRGFFDECLAKHEPTRGLPRFSIWKAASEDKASCFDLVCSYDLTKAPPPVVKPILEPDEEFKVLIVKVKSSWSRLLNSWDEKFFALVTLADVSLERARELIERGEEVEEASAALAAIQDAALIISGALGEGRIDLALRILEDLSQRFAALKVLARELPGPLANDAIIAFGKAVRGVEDVANQLRVLKARMKVRKVSGQTIHHVGKEENTTTRRRAILNKADAVVLGGLAAIGVGTLVVIALKHITQR